MKKTLYHATNPENVFSIIQNGFNPGADGYIYFCDTIDDSLIYSMIYHARKPHDVAVIPIEFDEDEIQGMEINRDNDPRYTPTSYAYHGAIDKSRIPKLKDIPKMKIELKHNLRG